MTRDELFSKATVFEFGDVFITKSPLRYPEGEWYIKKGSDLLFYPSRGWVPKYEVTDGGFLFSDPLAAASALEGYNHVGG